MRNKKISADISEESNNLLNGLVLKHDRSKGWLLDKMIKKYCSEEKPTTANIATVKKNPAKRFTPPTLQEVNAYMIDRGINDSNEAQSFCDFYESKGWVVGRTKMKCWKAAVRNWLKGYKEKQSSNKDILQISADSDWHLEKDEGF